MTIFKDKKYENNGINFCDFEIGAIIDLAHMKVNEYWDE